MNDTPLIWVDDWQEAHDAHPDQPVILVWFYGTTRDIYMRYHEEFYNIDYHQIERGSLYFSAQRWRIAGVTFTSDSIAWMLNNSIDYPFSREDFVLYQLTWSDGHE